MVRKVGYCTPRPKSTVPLDILFNKKVRFKWRDNNLINLRVIGKLRVNLTQLFKI